MERGTQCHAHSRCSIKASSSLSPLPHTGQGTSIPHGEAHRPLCHLYHLLPGGQRSRLTPTAWLHRALWEKQTAEGGRSSPPRPLCLDALRRQRAGTCPEIFLQTRWHPQSSSSTQPTELRGQCWGPEPQELRFKSEHRHTGMQPCHHSDPGWALAG